LLRIRRKAISAILSVLFSGFFARGAEARVYIDITAPRGQLPLAVQEFVGPLGKELSDIVREDLLYTGLFLGVPNEAFIEPPGAGFDRKNWSVLGAEAVVKGRTEESEGRLVATVFLYDVFEGRTILSKSFRADKEALRPLAHSIANDIYKELTGQEGIFRTSIVFVSQSDGLSELRLMDWDGRNQRGLGIKSSALLSPRWSEDASRLLYTSERKRQWGIYSLDLLRAKENLVFSSGSTDIAGDFFPGSGEFALSSSKAGTPDIYVYNIQTANMKALTAERGIEVSPAISPDGGTIAYVSDRGGSPQIYTMDKMGYNKTRITFEGSYNTSPAWSPRGDAIAFSGRSAGKNQIFTVRPDGLGLRMLTEAGNNEDPSFSPDGRFIAFTSDRDGGKGIYVMRSDGEGQRKISAAGARASFPRWSPK
jgi:TolB protein